MTGSGLGNSGQGGSVLGAEDRWTRLLVPLLTAALVLALGMILVGLTSRGGQQNDDITQQPTSAPAKSAVFGG